MGHQRGAPISLFFSAVSVNDPAGKKRRNKTMLKAVSAVIMSVLLLVFLSGCGQSDQPAKPQPPAKAEQPKAAPAKPEQPQADPAKPDHPKHEHPK